MFFFSDRSTSDKSVSVSLEEPILADGLDEYFLLSISPNFENFGVAKASIKEILDYLNQCQEILDDPTDDDPYHALVEGEKNKKTKKDLAKMFSILIEPQALIDEKKCPTK